MLRESTKYLQMRMQRQLPLKQPNAKPLGYICYSDDNYLYGNEPNTYFKECLSTLKPRGRLTIEVFTIKQIGYDS